MKERYISMNREEIIKMNKRQQEVLKKYRKMDKINELNAEILELNTTKAILLKEMQVLEIERQLRELEAQRRELEQC